MIEFKTGDILVERTEALVNTVNCVGVMGRGVALQFKNAFPENFKAYARACERQDVRPGQMFVYETGLLTPPRFIINFPTKRHWKGKSRIEDIDSGLKALVDEIRQRHIQSIAIPPLGAGLGGLDWGLVRPRMVAALQDLPNLHVVIFEPGASRETAPNPSTPVPKMTPGRAALVGLMHRYLEGLLDPSVTLLEVHKLMYFLQEAGEPLHLRFSKGHYGPYAENLRHVLKAVEGHLLTGYLEGGDAPEKELELVPGAVKDAQATLSSFPDTMSRMDRVSILADGFESSSGLELLATVHWVVVHEAATDLDDIVGKIHAWNTRKRQFTPRQIGIAVDVLTRKGWLKQMQTKAAS